MLLIYTLQGVYFYRGYSVRSREELIQGLLKRAFNEGRGDEMIAEIDRRLTRIREWADEDSDFIAAAKMMDGTSRGIRAFNMVARAEGRDDFLVDTVGASQEGDQNDETDYGFTPAPPKPSIN